MKNIEPAEAITRRELLALPLFTRPIRHPSETVEQPYNQARRLALRIVLLDQWPEIPPELDAFTFKLCKSMIFYRLHSPQLAWVELVHRVGCEVAEAERAAA